MLELLSIQKKFQNLAIEMKDLEELLKTTSYSGELIFAYLISVFEDNERLSQTELVNRVKKI
jgi:hypothetical protein